MDAVLPNYPLNPSRSEIRLLRIHPIGDGIHEPLHGTLQICSLDNNPFYIALSYVWGDMTATSPTPIIIDGNRIHVTINLAAALEVISGHEYACRGIWIDAICIDQINIPERNWQVKMMGRIYEGARNVYTWLGPECDRSTAVMALITKMGDDLTRLRSNDAVVPWLADSDNNLSWLCNPQYTTLVSPFGDESDTIEKAFDALFRKRQYWRRAWTLQEMALAKGGILLCGSQWCSMNDIFLLVFWAAHRIHLKSSARPPGVNSRLWLFITRLIHAKSIPMESANVLGRRAAKQKSQWVVENVMEALSITVNRQAWDPRDKIYSLLSLANFGIAVDYSIPVAQLYQDVAKAVAEGGAPILGSLLEFTGRCLPRGNHHLPSWVPDWEVLSQKRQQWLGLNDLFCANNGFHARPSATRALGDTLLVRGVHVTRIEEVLDGDWTSVYYFIDVLKFLFRCDMQVAQSTTIPQKHLYRTGIPLLQAVLRTFFSDSNVFSFDRKRLELNSLSFDRIAPTFLMILTAAAPLVDSATDTHWKNIYVPQDDAITIIRQLFLSGPTAQPPYTWDEILASAAAASQRHNLTNVSEADMEALLTFSPFIGGAGEDAKHAVGIKPFHTADGYMGYAKDGVREGDLVCVLQDSKAPVILRKAGDVNDNNDRYEVVSICFVLGMMDGEVGGLVQHDGLRLQEFSIC